MDGITTNYGLSGKMNSADMYKTQMEVEAFNKSLKTTGREPLKTMGKDEFLKLLITELQHQDPTNPMQDREFISQMSQFSSLEQMLNMNNNMEKFLSNMSFNSSFDLLGKNVELQTPGKMDEEGMPTVVKGTVQSVSKNGANSYIRVNGTEYPTEYIVRVSE
ncbi:MAG TPA: flagellar hook assembly protein FlgD [Spirochaetota bacterium]|nr:flagellar hook assembly protein FlgD [Spirochaetota bacterium]HOS33070.1 flagellar hook assembly protein FlgD [Spirochaetota bacterium]HOS56325.1 flagellar hook assembly protein FlgD [Spirochaetota bacterium]HQF78789.1 flagellar hook assembly protein FlgD [Spirochaetota bacterium]HQH30502.1 flagellar hook assembly protein FlgD [Spirochaetota bacterium]